MKQINILHGVFTKGQTISQVNMEWSFASQLLAIRRKIITELQDSKNGKKWCDTSQ